MKSVTAKVITISSQLLVVSLFLILIFSDRGNNESLTISNNNFDKMADKTSILFKREEVLLNVNTDIIIPLDDESKEENSKDDVKVEEEIKVEEKEENKNEIKQEEVVSVPPVVSPSVLFYDREVLRTEVGNLTGYGANCDGCSGITASGHNLIDSIYYNDSEFGTVRILAADKEFPFYSIFRVSDVPGMEPFIGIVLDRGGNVGFDRGTLFDLAYTNESDPSLIHLTKNVKFELLRNGR